MAIAIPLIAAAAAGGGAAAAGATTATALGAAGLAASALGSVVQGQQASNAANFNAQVQQNNALLASRNAGIVGAEGAANAGIEQQKTRAQVGGIKAAQAANGVDVNSGSAVDVRSSASELGELNAINIRSNAAREAYGFQTQAAGATGQAELDKSQSGHDESAGYVNAGSSLLSGGSKGVESGLWDKWLGSKSMNTGGADGGEDYTNSFAPVD